MYSEKMEELMAELAYEERLSQVNDYMYRNQDKIRQMVNIAIQYPDFYKEFTKLNEGKKCHQI